MSNFVAVIEWQVQSNWFELDAPTRRDYTRQLHEIILRYPRVRFRWFDAEAWTGKFTDFSLCEFEDLVCPSCGQHLKATAKFCGGCGSINAYYQAVPAP